MFAEAHRRKPDITTPYVRPLEYADIEQIEQNLRPEDRRELEAAGISALHNLKRAYADKNLINYAILSPMTGRAFGVFGVNPANGIIWMVSTPEIQNYKTKFLRGSRGIIKAFHAAGVPVLWNWVAAYNQLHIKWLTKWLRFRITAEGRLGNETYYKLEHHTKGGKECVAP